MKSKHNYTNLFTYYNLFQIKYSWTGKNKGLHRNEIVTGFKNLKKQYKLKDQQITDIKR